MESEEECFERQTNTYEISKLIVAHILQPEPNQITKKKIIWKHPQCIYQKIDLFIYNELIDDINIVHQHQSESTLQYSNDALALMTEYKQREIPKFCHIIKKMNQIFTKFNENPEAKHDMTIFLSNIKTITKVGLLRRFQPLEDSIPCKNRKMFLFSSNFESGNLHFVYRPKEEPLCSIIYYLFLQNDINTHGYNQWFFFEMKPQWQMIIKKSITVRLCIANISKRFILREGMKVLVYVDGKWEYAGNCLLLYQNKFNSYSGGKYMCLDFQYTFNYKKDSEYYFSLVFPYTYSKLIKFLKQINKIENQNISIDISTIGKTEAENSLYLIKFDSKRSKRELKTSKRKAIIIIARQHPIETSSSFLCEHIINQLVSTSSLQIEEEYTWFIFPMCNPDGVIHGHTRTNLKGYDINRCWSQKDLGHSCENAVIDLKISEILKQYECEYALDLHGHSKETGIFCFFAQKNRRTITFNHLLKEKCEYYRYKKSNFGVSYKKRPTFRGQMYHRHEISNVITVQTSIFGFQRRGRLKYFQSQDYQLMAKAMLGTIMESGTVSNEKYRIMNKELKQETRNSLNGSKNKIGKTIQSDSDSNPEGEYLQEKQRQMLLIGSLSGETPLQFKAVEEEEHSKIQPFNSSENSQDEPVLNVLNTSFLSRFKDKAIKQQKVKKPIYTNSSVNIPQVLYEKNRQIKRYSVERLHKSERKPFNRQIKKRICYSLSKKINGIHMVSQSGINYPTQSNVKIDLSTIHQVNSFHSIYKQGIKESEKLKGKLSKNEGRLRKTLKNYNVCKHPKTLLLVKNSKGQRSFNEDLI